MLTIEVPELRRYNLDFFRQLFDQLWPGFQLGHLGEGLHEKHLVDTFYMDSVFIIMETFTRSIDEMVQAVNVRRPFDLNYVIYDYNDYMDTYSFEDPEMPNVNMERLEGLMFEFFHYLIEYMIAPEFLAAVTAQLTRSWESLNGIVGNYGVVGIWYEPYVGANNMWDAGDKVYGIQEGDFQVMHTAPWEGNHSTSSFYPHLSNADDEFYWLAPFMIKSSYANETIPRGQVVSLCRLNENVIHLMDQ
ncbi:hypothetical protein pEaSNUABM9_00151 [Erwinia phage pEa_SNUABM_9]|nr:hypothetical protein pEaSNUABM9_00151 [Erwinia phage pEa_SNUABM_9]